MVCQVICCLAGDAAVEGCPQWTWAHSSASEVRRGLEAHGHTVPVQLTPGTATPSETKALLSLHVRLASGEAASTEEAGEMGQLF